MAAPISIRLDDDVRQELESQAQTQGIGRATLLRNLAKQAGRDAKQARIRVDSKRGADHVAKSPEAKAFFEFWGSPDSSRPAVVVDDDELFDGDFLTVLLVPMTDLATTVIEDLAVLITPTVENGCTEPCWAVSYLPGHSDFKGAESN